MMKISTVMLAKVIAVGIVRGTAAVIATCTAVILEVLTIVRALIVLAISKYHLSNQHETNSSS